MGVEGKERQRELEAGAQVLSGHMGKTIQRLRKAYNLSLSELAEQSGVAKSIISQIERNETNPTLATIWRLSQALDVSIERVLARGRRRALHREIVARPTRRSSSRRTARCASPSSAGSRPIEWLQWYDVQAEPGGVLEFRPASARLGGVPVGARGRVRGRGRRGRPARQGGRDACATAATAAIRSVASATRPAAPPWCASSKRR